jgi:alkylation response protein AidB-like acyl-CoA dehydrogenase
MRPQAAHNCFPTIKAESIFIKYLFDLKGGFMSNLLVDQRDQKFILHDMLKIEQLCQTSLYGHLSKEVIDGSLDAALELAMKESYPIMAEADRQGVRLENGEVRVPGCYHRLKKHYDQAELASAYLPREMGGHGYPMTLWTPIFESFVHNFGFVWPWASPLDITGSIAMLGNEEQKKKYLPNLVAGKWGSAVAFTEEQAGVDDIARQTTTAVPQPDGSYRLKGVKPTVTCGDSDMFENMVLCVLARIEGAPKDANGLSLFIVPKYLVNPDGSLGERNDYTVTGVEQKLGLRGSPTTALTFGEKGACHAELLGPSGQAMALFIGSLQKCTFYGAISTGIASAAYLHTVDYTRKRIHGPLLAEIDNPDAQRVPIIAQPFVRQRLLWMKSHVEGLRALVYYCCLCLDKASALADPAEQEKWSGITDTLFPVFRHYAAEKAFKVAEMAVKMHGRYGYFNDYPVHQFMRDIIPIGWWEGDAGGNNLFYLTQLLGQREGQDFANLLAEMNRTIEEFSSAQGLADLAEDLRQRVSLLGEIGRFFGDCFKAGKMLVPISNGLPFIQFMGDICLGWMLFWQAGVATKSLAWICNENNIDSNDETQHSGFFKRNKQAAFYDGKIHGARYFIKHVLPQVDGVAAAIKSEDLSPMDINEQGF